MNPIKKHFSLFAAILGLLPVASPATESSPQADKKPNIIFILLDDVVGSDSNLVTTLLDVTSLNLEAGVVHDELVGVGVGAELVT